MVTRFLKKLFLRQVEKILEGRDFKYKLVRAINNRIDLPGMTETEEGKLIDAMVTATMQILRSAL